MGNISMNQEEHSVLELRGRGEDVYSPGVRPTPTEMAKNTAPFQFLLIDP
jgi:hypothetical protein